MVLSVNLKDAVVSLPVNLLPRGVPHCALPLYKAALVFFFQHLSPNVYLMEPVGLLQLHILKTELADPQLRTLAIFFRVGGKIPGFNFKPPYLNSVDVFHLANYHNDFSYYFEIIVHLGQSLMLFFQGSSGWVHLSVSLLHMVDLVVFSLLVPSNFPVRLCKLMTIFTLGVGVTLIFLDVKRYLLKSIIA